jgi:hypothetical protein
MFKAYSDETTSGASPGAPSGVVILQGFSSMGMVCIKTGWFGF